MSRRINNPILPGGLLSPITGGDELTAAEETLIGHLQAGDGLGEVPSGTVKNTGALSPGTMADDDTVGTRTWSNTDNAKTSNNVDASFGTSIGKTYSHYIKATNFEFSIPVGATINGILVEIEMSDDYPSYNYTFESETRIVKADGSIGTTNKSIPGTVVPHSDTYVAYGANNDLWGEIWTPTDINDIDFGVVFSAYSSGYHGLNVDHIRITVYYTEEVDGITTVFTLLRSPSPASSLTFYIDGQLKKAGGEDYTLSGNTITLVDGSLAPTGSKLLAFYFCDTDS